MMTYLITVPAATTTISEIGAYSSVWFEEFLPFLYLVVGIFVGIGLIALLGNLIYNAIMNLNPESRANRRKRRLEWEEKVEQTWK